MAITDSPNLDIRTFTDFSSTEPRDPQSGKLLRHLTQLQLDSVLEKYPHLRAEAPTLADPNAKPKWETPTAINGRTWYAPEKAALLKDPAPTRSVTKPTVNTLSNHRRNLHESSHGIASYLLKRPIVRISVLEKDGNAGHVLHYNPGAPNKDDLVLLAAGRAGEEVLLHSVYEHGCSGDDEKARELALKLSGGDTDAANTLLREAAMAARALVEKYSSAIHKFSMRLAIKKEFVLDEAENEIRACIAVFEKPVQRSISEPTQKVAGTTKKQPQRGRVLREYDFSKQADIQDWNKRMGNENVDAEPIGFGAGHIVTESFR